MARKTTSECGKIPNVQIVCDMINAVQTLKEDNNTGEVISSKTFKAGVTLNPEKGIFNVRKVPFYDVIFSKEGYTTAQISCKER